MIFLSENHESDQSRSTGYYMVWLIKAWPTSAT